MIQQNPSPIRVRIDEDTNIEKALKKFKRLCETFGITREYRKRKEYKKPSIRLKEKQEAAVKRRNKAMMKMNKHNSKI